VCVIDVPWPATDTCFEYLSETQVAGILGPHLLLMAFTQLLSEISSNPKIGTVLRQEGMEIYNNEKKMDHLSHS